ncbi:hypothetical protein FOC1_g10000206 [Fusarium oxysporum f. sp. cubense race 1]|uniref:Enoyl reductase (ER) domain-containing protein n=1 Tax=Fusarium oxysporum f. sp. cubense (strain race 1) TaxID=1229664 RepID=N4U7H9_FUSC1|nr:hypothetical protein FOC1_g10000206 [Fusarium oxysporum f. sp. cubense race 1]
MSLPKTTKGWAVVGQGSFDNLKFDTQQPLPELSDNEVLVKFHAASLNFRDIMIAQGTYPFDVKANIIPGSDGAGEVVAIGKKVTRFQEGSKVMTLFMQAYFGGPLTPKVLGSAVGGSVDGTMREYGVFNENGLVDMPKNLSYLEAATLPCSALTAWNALYGLRTVLPGDWVLTQGTGGVSISALQFAKAAGARVVATTSSTAKAQKLRELGADHVINYKEIPNWGEEAKRLTEGGVDHVLEVGGAHTITESLKAVNIGGYVTIIGWIAGPGETGPSFPQILSSMAVVRGIVVGSRDQFEAMIRAIEASDIQPVLDQQVFKLEELKDAYQYLVDQKHFGKVFAKAAGARVVATTSSTAKAQKLRELGADHVINYKEIPNWGEEAKRLTEGGVDHVLEVGGAHTITESLKAVNIGGYVTIIGWIAGPGETGPSFPQILSSMAVVRGIVVGSRDQFEAMIRAIEASDIQPVLDQQVFKLEELKDAYQYLVDQKHFGKVVIKIE